MYFKECMKGLGFVWCVDSWDLRARKQKSNGKGKQWEFGDKDVMAQEPAQFVEKAIIQTLCDLLNGTSHHILFSYCCTEIHGLCLAEVSQKNNIKSGLNTQKW